MELAEGYGLNTRAAGSGENTLPYFIPPTYVANPDENVLDDMRETVERFVVQNQREGKIPYRLIYMFGGANVSGARSGQNSDLGLLLQLIQQKQRTDAPNSMTYVYAFDSSYNEENVRRDVDVINGVEPRAPRENLIVPREPRRNIIEPPGEGFYGGAQAVKLRHQPFPTETFFPARYSYGPNCYIFFFDAKLASSCLTHIPTMYNRQQYVKREGFTATALLCSPQEGSAYAYLQSLAQRLLTPEGELYIYNCAWEDTTDIIENASGRVIGSRYMTLNLYFETLPEALFLAFNDYHPNRVNRFLLYNQFRNLFRNEDIVVRATTEEGHLRQVTVEPDTEFASVRRGGKRKTRRRSKKTKSKSRRWRKA